jgi:uncharacterized protein YecE (DUF72 family)
MILTGTCSWTEKTLIQSGEFYPKNTKTAEARLKFYAQHFNTVEVDSTYYAIPNKQTACLWADRTPDNFLFHIKVYGALTGHGIDPKTLPVELQKMLPEDDFKQKRLYIKEPHLLDTVAQYFRDALYPLINKGKLGIILFQFPPWFLYKNENLDYILQCKQLMAGLDIAVEFRHGSWLSPRHQDSIFYFLRENQITYVTADEPQYGSLATIPFVPAVTTDVAYFRFHGRNKENWLKRGIETSLRFSYLYSDKELLQFKKVLQQADKRAKVTYAMFNNCHGSFAVRNAWVLQQEIRG